MPQKKRRVLHGDAARDIRDDSSTADESLLSDEWEEADDICSLNDLCSILPLGKENVVSKKVQRAERKLAKNQARFNIITSADVARVDAALHPCQTSDLIGGLVDPLADSTIEANVKFHSGTFKFSSLRQNIHVKRMLKNNGLPKVDEGEAQGEEGTNLAVILHRLDIITTVLRNTRERKSLLTKLHEAIRYDLDCVANEDRDTMTRMAGYWRYANRRTYNVMVRNNQLWDWTTGMKLEEVEEEEEEDDLSSMDERFSEMSTAATTPIIPHYFPDIDSCSEDFDLAEGTALSIERTEASDAIDDEKTPTRATFMGQADSRHLQTPVRVIAASAIAPIPTSPLTQPKPVTPWKRPPAPHHDANNRFSPLSAITEDDEPTTPTRPTTRPPATITIIARNRSPSRHVRFPSLRGSSPPLRGRRQHRGGQNGGSRGGLPAARGAGKPSRGNNLSYAGMLRRGL